MELDSFLDVEGCCTGSTFCVGAIAVAFINALSSSCARTMLVFSKFGGVILDIWAIVSVINNGVLAAMLIMYLIIDRTGALIMICVYGFRPTEAFKRYAYYMEASGKVKSAKGLESLYYGSIFSLPDFMGKIWKSYTFVIKIDPTKVKKYEDRENNATKNNNTTPATVVVSPQSVVTNNTVPIQVIQQPQPIQYAVNTVPIQVVQTQQPQQALPHGWSAKLDPNGRVYYQNDITHQTQWTHPSSQNMPSAPTMPSYQAPKPMQIQMQVVQPNQPGQQQHSYPQLGNNGYPGNVISVELEKVTSDHSGTVACYALFYILAIFILMMIMYFVGGFSFFEGAGPKDTFSAAILFISLTANVLSLAQHAIFIGTGVLRKCKVKNNNCCCICCAQLFCFLMGIVGVLSFIFTVITMAIFV